MIKQKIIITAVVLGVVLIVVTAINNKQTNNNEPSEVFNNLKQSDTSSINLEKVFYKPNEEVYIQITADCESELELLINEKKLEVGKSNNCGEDSNQANFFATFKSDAEGDFKITLTEKSSSEVSEAAFIVSNTDADFRVSRWGSKDIKLYRSNRSVMKITVVSNNDFKGQIIENIPDSINILWQGPAKLEENKLVWDVDLKAGVSQEFTYEYTSENSIKLGPAELKTNRKTLYTEQTSWQVTVPNDE